MKKILMLFLALIIIFNVKNVYAQEDYHISFQKIDGVYSYRIGENYNNDSHSYYIYKFGDMIAYCLQPGKSFKTYDYLGEDNFVKLSLSEEVQEKIELIGYYGREYPGHDTTRYSMATQALIWELTGVDSVTYWTELNGKGKEIDVTNERNEIMRLVNIHKTLPSISKSITGSINKEIIITDANNVLENYEIIDSGGNEVVTRDNTIRIIPRVIGESTITLKHKKYDNLDTVIFVSKDGSDSQILGRLRLSVTEKSFDIKLNTKGTKLKVNKKDDEGNIIKQEGIRFKIKDIINDSYLCEESICEYQTNNEGYFITNYINYGEYEIEEIEDQELYNYLWNPNKVSVVINSDTELKEETNYNYIEKDFINKKVKGDLEINKKGEAVILKDNSILYQKIDLSNIEFDLFNNENELIDTIKTDDNGYAKYSGLLIGKYYIKEKTKLDNYIENNEKIYFEIKKENNLGNIVSLEIPNYLKKSKLEFTKKDLVTDEGIPDTIIEIYNDKDELLFTKRTDENGLVVINEIPFGKYYIVEKEANELYLLTNEKVFFEIKENNEIIKAVMTNEKKEVEVPKTDTDEEFIAHIIFIVLFLIGVGGLYYEKRIH